MKEFGFSWLSTLLFAPPRFTLTYRVFLLPIDFSRPMVLLSVFFLTARETSAPVWFLIYAPERSNSVV
jgi:hypothetical protein